MTANIGPYERTTTTDSCAGVRVSLPGETSDGCDIETHDFAVYLPHDCDEWVIACDPDPAVVKAKVIELIESLALALGAIDEWRSPQENPE